MATQEVSDKCELPFKEQLPDFSTITEAPWTRATAEQLEMMQTRYELASRHAREKDVLEVGCGAGVGLGLISRVARSTVGGDIDLHNCAVARETYRNRRNVTVTRLDAMHLPFSDANFDVLVLFEVLYYIRSFDSFLLEARRVLRPGGVLLISSVNCRWRSFNPSPLSVEYYDAAQLAAMLTRRGFYVDMFAGFPDDPTRVRDKLTRVARRLAIRAGLIPKTMKGKEWLKRIFLGSLRPIPAELSGEAAPSHNLVKILPPYRADQFKFIYSVALLSQP